MHTPQTAKSTTLLFNIEHAHATEFGPSMGVRGLEGVASLVTA